MLKRWREEGGPDPRSWMLTFSDLVTLLLTFFVMLLATRLPEIERLRQAFGPLRQQESGSRPPSGPSVDELQGLIDGLAPGHRAGAALPEGTEAEADEALKTDALLAEAPDRGLTARREERGVVITLINDLTFAPQGAELSPQAQDRLRLVGRLLKSLEAPVSVEGHSDSQPLPPGGRYKDNWELSLARARAVLERLWRVEGIDPARLRLGALADSRPLEDNDTPAGRAANRRTEIVILAESR
jgi:chemotaxis protein MotB